MKLLVIEIPKDTINHMVTPTWGMYNLYYWTKGDEGNTWIKADLYGPDGEIESYGIIGDTLGEVVQEAFVDYIGDSQ